MECYKLASVVAQVSLAWIGLGEGDQVLERDGGIVPRTRLYFVCRQANNHPLFEQREDVLSIYFLHLRESEAIRVRKGLLRRTVTKSRPFRRCFRPCVLQIKQSRRTVER